MKDNYCFSVGCIVRKGTQVLLVRHTYGGANGKLLIPGGFSTFVISVQSFRDRASDISQNRASLFSLISLVGVPLI